MKLQILLDMGLPPKQPESKQSKKSVEDKVREAIELVESGYCSHVEWLMLNRLMTDLKKSKQKKSQRVQNLISMIEPVLSKYGYHGVEHGDE